jgi:hypothetical protein
MKRAIQQFGVLFGRKTEPQSKQEDPKSATQQLHLAFGFERDFSNLSQNDIETTLIPKCSLI